MGVALNVLIAVGAFSLGMIASLVFQIFRKG